MIFTAAHLMLLLMGVTMQTGKHIQLIQQGYTFIGLLLILTLTGFTLAQAGNLWSQARQREKELELLKIGDKFRQAIGNYYNATPGEVKQYPPSLEALLKDNRYPQPRRYLRKIYVDPMTNMAEWGTVEGPGGGIMGVMSMSDKQPFKTKQFPLIYKSFENKKFYAEWMFVYSPFDEMLQETPKH